MTFILITSCNVMSKLVGFNSGNYFHLKKKKKKPFATVTVVL